MNKILTVSIAAYNVEDYIRRALDSLMDEDIIDDLEIFVVDDGGTDGTLAIAQEYAQKYPQSIFPVHKENGGYGSTINYSVAHATGKYFKQLDGDDWFCFKNLKEFVGILRETSADVVLTSNLNYYEDVDRYRIFDYKYAPEGLHDIEKVSLHTRFSVHTVTFLTNILKKTDRPLTEHCFYTDSEFISYPLPYLQTIYIWHEPVYVYRIGGRDEQSSSIKGIAKHYKEMEFILAELLELYCALPKNGSTKIILMQALIQARISELFKFYTLLPLSLEALEKVKALNNQLIKSYPELLDKVKKENKMVKLLVDSQCLAYPVAHFWLRYRWRRFSKGVDFLRKCLKIMVLLKI